MAMNIKQEEINTLDSRVFADATHKNDSRMSESGRSMVEILGVLAVVGVLSVGGIAGYSYAIAKYKASTIMSELNLRAIPLSNVQTQSPAEANTPLTMEMGNTMKSGNEVSAEVSVNPEYFEITVADVEKQACELILQEYTTSAWIAVNGTLYENATAICSEKENFMTFVYKNDLGERRNCAQKGFFSLDSYKCECAGGTYFDNTAKDCVCPAGTKWTGSECTESRCGDNEFESLDSGCVSCEDPNVYTISQDSKSIALCNACPNRKRYNLYCTLKCPENHIWSKNYGCISCEDNTNYVYVAYSNESINECIACPNHIYFKGHCVPKTYCTSEQYLGMLSGAPRCFSCYDENEGVSDITSQEEIDQCNSCTTSDGIKIRSVINNQCKKTLCDTNEFKGKNGACYDCFHPSSIEVDINSECNTICFNRIIENGYCKISDCSNGILMDDGTCYDCNTTFAFQATEKQCNSCKDENGKQIRGWMDTGYCRLNNCTLGKNYSESSSSSIGYWATSCTVCRGRDGSDGAGFVGFSEYTKKYCEACSGNYVGSDGYCYYGASCQRGEEFRSHLKVGVWDFCTSCDYTEKVKMAGHEEHDKMCADCVSTPRFFADNYCYRCDSSESPVVTTAEERASCTKCPNRQINAEGKCELIKTED